VKKIITILSILLLGVFLFFQFREESGESLIVRGGGQAEEINEIVKTKAVEKSKTVDNTKPIRDKKRTDREVHIPESVKKIKPLSLKEEKDKKDKAIPRDLSERELEELELYLDQVEEQWTEGIRDLIYNEFGLGEKEYEAYLDLRDEFEEAKLASYDNWHEEKLRQQGEGYQYRPSEFNSSNYDELIIKYMDRTKNIFGEENFKRYIEYLDRFNEDMEATRRPEMGQIRQDM
jgi:hypothetical protein